MDGYRTLEGAEAQLFRAVLAAFVEELVQADRGSDEWPIGIEAFDEMEYPI